MLPQQVFDVFLERKLNFGLTLEQTLPSFEKPGPEALLLFGIRHAIKLMASKKKEIYSRDRGKLVLN